MVNLIEQAKAQLQTVITRAADRAAQRGSLPSAELSDYSIDRTTDSAHGDFAANAALKSAKSLRLAPRAVAQAIADELSLEGTFFERCEVAGPGFLNFFLAPSFADRTITAVLSEGDDYGRTDFGGGEKVMVEFVSANPTGPMHIGNARGGALGDCLAAVLDWSGHKVTREFYINDAGNQIEKFSL